MKTTARRTTALQAALVAAALAGAGCGAPPAWAGRYTSAGTWNLGGPLANGRTVGDSAADLLVERAIALSGVPSVLEEKAHTALDAVVRPHVKAVVDPLAPPELAPGGSVYGPLSASLAAVKVESELTLKGGRLPQSLEGTETFTAFEYTHAGTAYRLDATALAAQGVTLSAGWSGKQAQGDGLEVEPYGVDLQFGALVQRIADRLVDAAGQTDLKNRLAAAVTCDQIVARVLASGPGLTITVADWSHTFSDAQLRAACDEAGPIIRQRVVGLVKVDSRVELGGLVTYAGAASELRSAAGFGGVVLVAPRALAPRLGVVFTAKRRP